jgi:hypothetical protein
MNLGMPELVLLALIGSACMVPLVVEAVVAALLSSALRRLPPRYRQMDPGLIWLLMIPLFGIGWNFFVVLKVSRSYRDYFAERGRSETGDCGEALGLAYSVCAACSLVPYLGCVTAVAALVLLVLYLVKMNTLKTLAAATSDTAVDPGTVAAAPWTAPLPPPPPPASPAAGPGASASQAPPAPVPAAADPDAPEARRCGRCGAALPGDAAFCPGCGAPAAP